MEIKNKKELDTWMFDHVSLQGHTCKGVKGIVFDEVVNVAFVDMVTNERFDIIYMNI